MIKHDSIFFKILIFIISLIIFICTILTVLSINVSEKLILNHIVETTNQSLDYVKADLLSYNTDAVQAISKVNQSTAFREYLSSPIVDNIKTFDLVTNLNQYVESNKEYLSPKDSYLIAVGKNSMWYCSNYLNWDIEDKNAFFKKDYLDKTTPNVIQYKVMDTSGFKKIAYDNTIFVSKPLVNIQNNDIYGFVYIVLDERVIYKMYSNYVEKGMTFSLISSEGEIISSSNGDTISKKDLKLLSYAKNIVNKSLSYRSIKLNNQDITILAKYVPFFDAYLVVNINHAESFGKLYNLKYYMIVILILLLLITSVAIYMICYKISQPLVFLVDTMSKTTRYRLDDRKVFLGNSYEMRMLTKAYNNMINEIDIHVKNLLSEQEGRRKAELNALQMQINPHFLYNTLSTIKYLAKSNKTKEVEDTIDCLSGILQNTIGKTDEMVRIETEVENLKLYEYINKLRFGSLINVDYQISKACLGLSIPKLIIQPFLENAFFHGFQGQDSGNITIYINKKENYIFIEIIDNGVGFDCSNIYSLKRTSNSISGIGIKNVDERIKLIYGKEYGVEINSEKGYGTCATIKIPFS